MKLFKCLALFTANAQACIPPLLFVGTTEACIPPLLFVGTAEACIPPLLFAASTEACILLPLRSDADGTNQENN